MQVLTCVDDNGMNATGLSDTTKNMHEYEIDWQPDTITWSIDGKVVRTLDRDSTWNATANRYSYPQTPARVQLSLWPGGLPSNGEGTINWAGGLVQWDSPAMVNGYYYAAFDQVSIECYDPPSGVRAPGNKAYIFTDKAMTNASVEITNNSTVLASLLGTGTNMSADYPHASASAKASDLATIPGLTGAGPGTDGQRGGDNSSSSSSDDSSSSSGSDSGSTAATATGSASTGFVQGDGGSSGNGAGQVGGNSESVLKGSLFAVIIALVGLCVL
jgi:beta-glucanase (GH16 family)